MSELPGMSVETVLQPFREACERVLRPPTERIVGTEVLSAEVTRVGSQCAADLLVMLEGVRPDSAVAIQMRTTARLHREEERELDTRFERLQEEVDVMVERAGTHASQQQTVIVLANDRCREAQRVASALDITTSSMEALQERAVAAIDAVASATDRLRALIRYQG